MMRGEKIVIVVLLLILSPIIIVFLMGTFGTLMGNDSSEFNTIVVGIAILCDLIIACTIFIVTVLERLVGAKEKKKSDD
jgi:hypothetical protein